MNNLISSTNQGHPYLHRHPWDHYDGLDMQQFRPSLEGQALKKFSEIQGEQLGHRYVTDILGYQEVFHGDNKSIRQGLDGIYHDPEGPALVVVEFKGQHSQLSPQQEQPKWTIETCEKIQRSKFPYHQVSQYEREFSGIVLEQYNSGQPLRHEVIRTEVDMKTGQWWSQLERQTHLEKGLEQPYPVQSLKPEQDFGVGT